MAKLTPQGGLQLRYAHMPNFKSMTKMTMVGIISILLLLSLEEGIEKGKLFDGQARKKYSEQMNKLYKTS
eukprot:4075111-Amphidinium_carterae.1